MNVVWSHSPLSKSAPESFEALDTMPRDGWTFVSFNADRDSVIAAFQNWSRIDLGDCDFACIFFSLNLQPYSLCALPADRGNGGMQFVHIYESNWLCNLLIPMIPRESWVVAQTALRILGNTPEVRHAC